MLKLDQVADEVIRRRDGQYGVDQVQHAYKNLTVRRNRLSDLKRIIIERLPNAPNPGIGAEFTGMTLPSKLKYQRLVRNKLPDTRTEEEKKVANISLLPDYVRDIKMVQADSDQIRINSEIKLKARTENVLFPTAESVEHLVTSCNDILRRSNPSPSLHKDDYQQILVALALCTGRRLSELMSPDLSLQPVKDYPRAALFDGQLKTGLEKRTSYVIPILADLEDIQKSLDILRAHYPVSSNATPKELHVRFRRFAHESVQPVKAVLSAGVTKDMSEQLQTRFHFHSLRELYACITFQTFQSSYSMHGWIRKVLGHSDLNISKAYSNIRWQGNLGLNVMHIPPNPEFEPKLDVCLRT